MEQIGRALGQRKMSLRGKESRIGKRVKRIKGKGSRKTKSCGSII